MTPLSVAVIGSGMAGLTAAHRCRQAGMDVTIFEARAGHGMDAHAMTVDGGIVDAPLRVMNPDAWPSVLRLAREVGVETFAVDTPISCNWTDGQTWFRSGRVPILGWHFIGHWRYLTLKSLRFGRGALQLRQLTRHLQQTNDNRRLSEVLESHPLDPLFWRGVVLPLLNTICTCDEHHLMAWPAQQLLSLLDQSVHGQGLYRLRGGTSALVRGIAKDVPSHVGSRVQTVRPTPEGVEVLNERGDGGWFDRVIVATQANQLQFLDEQHFGQEKAILKDIPFEAGELVIHQDERFMPQRKSDWAPLNFQMDRALNKPMFTVWVNPLEPTLSGKAPVFQTWSPLYEPKEEQILERIPLERAVVTERTEAVHRQLTQWHQQPGRQIFYCGSWAAEGVPLLESAVRSAETVVQRLSGELR